MSITTTHLTRAAGVSAVVAGLLFCGVQINHPPVDLAFVSTTEFAIRQSMKIAFTVLALIGITGMYLSQVKKAGVLGLIGYLILACGLPRHADRRGRSPRHRARPSSTRHPATSATSIAVATRRQGDRRRRPAAARSTSFVGISYMAGGLVFGIALFRANVLARWASILLAVATPLSIRSRSSR